MIISRRHICMVSAGAFYIASAASLLQSQPANQDTVHLEELVITARRPMQEIGVQTTSFDSIALKENIALSMADVLAFNSSVFVKSSGRASLSTVAFRGTSASHTNVSWNGLPVNNPMLGMTDFSTIPAFLIDGASLLHGTSSINEAGGGLGGAVALSTESPVIKQGVGASYVQGIGSFSTFDEFLRLSYSGKKWAFSTRAVYSSSANDYSYINRDKKLNIYDDDGNIISQYHPKEKNRSGAFKDFHLLQEIFYNSLKGDKLSMSVWYTASNREIPMISTDYGEQRGIDNRQRENTVRGVISWKHFRSTWNIDLRSGYAHTWLGYDYRRELTPEVWNTLTRSRTLTNTFFASAIFNFFPYDRWLFTASMASKHHDVRSSDRTLSVGSGAEADIGYHKRRLEMSYALTARWQPIDGVGLSAVIREESYGSKFSPLIPAIFADWTPLANWCGLTSLSLTAKASISRNYRHPTLNDLYFMPGGNPDLKNEKGWTYDCGLSFSASRSKRFNASCSATWFDSHIDDWIIWLPTFKGFFSPRNMKSVHAYGVELKAEAELLTLRDWKFDINASWAWTASINAGEKISDADKSVGKQLPYIPRNSFSAALRAAWKSWGLIYKVCAYSERFTMTSNASTLTGNLPPYSISNLSLDKSFRISPLHLQMKLAVNNLFNADYLSVLSRPMPGINFEAFLTLTW